MAIRKIVSRSIGDGAIGTVDLASGSLSSAGLDVTGAGGTGSALLPKGTTAERPASPVAGYIRFNTTTDCYEQYTSLGWAGIAAPPAINSISPTSFNGESGTTITVNGANFSAGAVVTFINSSNVAYNAAVTTFVNSSQLTATTPQDFTVADEPLDVKVTNVNGLSTTLADALDCGVAPIWSTAAGSLGTFGITLSVSISLSSSDADAGSTISYSITSGSLPTGLSLNSSTGAITGTLAGSAGTYSFTVTSTDNAGNASARAFSITSIELPSGGTTTVSGGYRYHTFTSSGNFVVPSTKTCEYLIVAGGGSGGVWYETGNYTNGNQGSNSSFNSQTAIGGGGGRAYNRDTTNINGGSGGGGGGGGATSAGSGTAGQGYAGGNAGGTSTVSGGGGGAGGTGQSGTESKYGDGGVGINWKSLGTYYAGGGGAGGATNASRGLGGSGGGGNGNVVGVYPQATSGAANTGGGGGAADGYWGQNHGGGGAGGAIDSSATFSAGTYPVTVGAGAAGVGQAGSATVSDKNVLSGAGGSGVVIIRYTL